MPADLEMPVTGPPWARPGRSAPATAVSRNTLSLPGLVWLVLLVVLACACNSPAEQSNHPGNAASSQEGPSRPNVIVIAIDTCRADHLGCYGYERDTTPNIDRFASQSVLFELCFSQANETLFSFASLLNSRLPSEIAPLSYSDFYIPETARTLPSILKIYGYQTGAFVAGGNISQAFGFSNGFDIYQDQWNFGSFHDTVPAALQWLDSIDPARPFFLFVHGYDAHAPYWKPLFFSNLFDPDYQGIADFVGVTPIEVEKVWNGRFYPDVEPGKVHREDYGDLLGTRVFSALAAQDPSTGMSFSREDMDHVIAHYDGSLVYADLYVGFLLNRLESRDLLENSMVVILGDHGEDLFEHGHVNHRITLHDASTHVPLIIKLPGGEAAGERVPDLVQGVDLLPTVLDLAGVPIPAYARGRSLLPLMQGASFTTGFAFSEGVLPMVSVRSYTHRLVVQGEMAGSPAFLEMLTALRPSSEQVALFRITGGQETRIHLDDNPQATAVADSMLNALKGVYKGSHPMDSTRQPIMDPQLIEAMVEKGYW